VAPPGNQAATEQTTLLLQPGQGLRGERSARTARQKAAAGIVGTRRVLTARTVGRRVHWRWDRGHAPAQPRELPVAARRGEAAVGASGRDALVGDAELRARVVERGHLRAALARVQRHGGSPGVDGMTVAG
jgi:hypothetical protein